MRSAADRIALVADAGSFEPWDEDVVSSDPLEFADSKPYTERLAAAREATGSSEAVQTGRATTGGRPIVVVASEFGFMGGSIGTATSARIARAFERARSEGLPLVAIPASGGTRMQEGSLGLTGMAKLAAAARRLRDAGLPYVVYLTHPTTGGVMASWASLATVTFAQPGALIGFGGPRVVELMTGKPLPEGVQTAENLHAHGLIDDVVGPEDLRERVQRVLAVAAGDGDAFRPAAPVAPPEDFAPARDIGAWESIQLARHPDRPTARDLLSRCATEVTELRGDGDGSDDPACLAALARVRGIPVMVVAQNRDREAATPARMSPPGFRKARRALAVAGELGLPVLTLVDTPGAEMSVAAEEGGLSRAIAHVLADMSTVATPTVAVLLGEGGSGGALALLPGDRVLCAEHASLSAIAPEGASAILYRTTERAPQLAATQAIASAELLRFGIVDRVVEECPSAERESEAFLDRVADTAAQELLALAEQDPDERLEARERRYRAIGELTQGGSA
ncbi:MAG: acyl-CoA carboxylase subunit beta [Thermoleophilales bacterium]|nr:acyl-CoA carboxylase subunit beta [Thermoleophilales bacterium]